MAVKPLATLLKEAEEFGQEYGQTKTASSRAAAADSSVMDLANELLNADNVEELDSTLEKTALAMNRANALAQIQTLQKLAQFRNKALSEGFSNEQVEEAVEKIAAKKLKENLKVLTAVSGATSQGHDYSLERTHAPANELGQPAKGLTTTVGY